MPVFFIVSGMLSSNKFVDSTKSLLNLICKKSIAYLLPFFSRIFVHNVIFNTRHGMSPISELKSVLFSIDSGLWFIWVLYILTVINLLSSFIANKISFRKNLILSIILNIILLMPWFLLLKTGSSFLGPKYILYYSLFYFVGKYGQIVVRNYSKMIKILVFDILFVPSFLIGIYLACNYDLYTPYDSVLSISFRVVSGFALSYVLIYSCKNLSIYLSKIKMNVIGQYTLEIYYVHGLAYGLFASAVNKPYLYSIDGAITFCSEIIITLLFTVVVISIIKSNRVTNLIFFGKLDRISTDQKGIIQKQ